MAIRSSLTRLIRRLSVLGVAEIDADETRAQKAALTLAAALVTVLAVIWVGTYWVLGLFQAAAIPFVYQVASVASLVVFAHTKSYRFFRFSQAAMLTLLPFLLQWTLGGYVASSAVSLWALVAAIGTLFFFTADESIPWFVAFLALTLLSGLLHPGPDPHRVLRPERDRRIADGLHPPPVRRARSRRGIRPFGGPPPQRFAQIYRRTAQARAGRDRRSPRRGHRPVRRRR